jgi:hypothetical protein
MKKPDADEYFVQLQIERLVWQEIKIENVLKIFKRFDLHPSSMVDFDLFRLFCIFNRFCVPQKMHLEERMSTFLLRKINIIRDKKIEIMDFNQLIAIGKINKCMP